MIKYLYISYMLLVTCLWWTPAIAGAKCEQAAEEARKENHRQLARALSAHTEIVIICSRAKMRRLVVQTLITCGKDYTLDEKIRATYKTLVRGQKNEYNKIMNEAENAYVGHGSPCGGLPRRLN